MNQTSQFERERAKRLYAAIMSMRLGTAFATEYKRIGDKPIARFWYDYADFIDRKWAELIDGRIAELLKPAERMIQ
jgi:hypothetical protein